jgi:hypothetical protein
MPPRKEKTQGTLSFVPRQVDANEGSSGSSSSSGGGGSGAPKSPHASSFTEAADGFPSSLIIPVLLRLSLPIEWQCIHSSLNALWSRHKIAHTSTEQELAGLHDPTSIQKTSTKHATSGRNTRDKSLGTTLPSQLFTTSSKLQLIVTSRFRNCN